MRSTSPLKLANRYKNVLLNRLVPLRKTEVDGLKFYYLRRDAPPHDPKAFSASGQEFHDKIRDLSGDTAIDVGANIGSYTLPLARKFRTVVAFEPNRTNSHVLRLNVALNKLNNVRVEEVALADTNGVLPLYIRGGGATSLDPSHYGLKYSEVSAVKVIRLDDFSQHLERLDFVKIDAENSELPILKGGENTISKFKPVLGVEVHSPRVFSDQACSCDSCRLMRSYGYEIEVTGELQAVGPVHWVWAVPKK